MFADVQVVLNKDEEDVKYTLRKLMAEYINCGLEIKTEKINICQLVVMKFSQVLEELVLVQVPSVQNFCSDIIINTICIHFNDKYEVNMFENHIYVKFWYFIYILYWH